MNILVFITYRAKYGANARITHVINFDITLMT